MLQQLFKPQTSMRYYLTPANQIHEPPVSLYSSTDFNEKYPTPVGVSAIMLLRGGLEEIFVVHLKSDLASVESKILNFLWV